MKIIELILDEESLANGIDAISIVSEPAIEENFIALKDEGRQEFAVHDKEKRILMGAALIPNKPIYRRNGSEEFYVYFSKDTIRRANELFFQRGHQNKATLEHEVSINGLSVVESWIIEDVEKDKSALYNMSLPVGTWMISMKVENDDVWENYVKTGKVQGFSIEGYFADKMKLRASIEEQEAELILSEIRAIIRPDARYKKGKRMEMESYSDYGQGIRNNAKRGIELNEKNGNKCATQTGKVRAQQIAQGKPLSLQTIKRMYSYLSRAEEYYDPNDTSACGTISFLLWGGKSALGWSRNKLRELGELE